jgi:hypothetical protein
VDRFLTAMGDQILIDIGNRWRNGARASTGGMRPVPDAPGVEKGGAFAEETGDEFEEGTQTAAKPERELKVGNRSEAPAFQISGLRLGFLIGLALELQRSILLIQLVSNR